MEKLKLTIPPLLSEAEVQEKIRRYEEAEAFRRQVRQDEQEREDRALRGIPRRFRRIEPETWSGGVLWGPAGVGKTYQAIARLASVRGVFVDALELIDLARDYELDRASEFGRKRLAKIENAGHLVLDDIGVRRPTDFALETLYRIIDDRWTNETPTLITSNLSPADMEAALGDRIVSRMLAFGPCEHMTGKDRRLER